MLIYRGLAEIRRVSNVFTLFLQGFSLFNILASYIGFYTFILIDLILIYEVFKTSKSS